MAFRRITQASLHVEHIGATNKRRVTQATVMVEHHDASNKRRVTQASAMVEYHDINWRRATRVLVMVEYVQRTENHKVWWF